jgi:signal transduction histidine kinase/HAMP domain-containing protein
MSLKKRFALFTLAFLLLQAGALLLLDRQLDAVKMSRRSIREDQQETVGLFELRRPLAAMRDAIQSTAATGKPWPAGSREALLRYTSLVRKLNESSAKDHESMVEGERVEIEAVKRLERNVADWRALFFSFYGQPDKAADSVARALALFREGNDASAQFLRGSMLELTSALDQLEASEDSANKILFQGTAGLLALVALGWIGFGFGLLAPVGRLRELVRRLQRHNFDAADLTPIRGSGEIAELMTAFAEMSRELRDFTETLEKRVAERTEELEASRRRLSRMLNHLPDSVALADAEGRIEAANEPWRRLFGESQQSPFAAILAEPPANESGERLWRGADDRERLLAASRFPLDDGERRLWLEHVRDVTRQREIEAALATSQKLAALGRLSAGIAHEVNNPLAAIGACAEGLLKRLGRGGSALETEAATFRDYLETIRDEVLRCKEITEKLLDHSRQRHAEPVAEFDAAAIAADVVRLVEPLAARKGATLTFETESAGETSLFGSVRALKQILLNLTLNAVEACDQGNWAKVVVRGGLSEVLIEVSDNGAGIAREDLERLFEPFFTKRPGGTGLGLFVCQGMADAMDGRLSVASEGEGKGAVFSLRLPRRLPASPATGLVPPAIQEVDSASPVAI